MKCTQIADELIANATALNDEVSRLAKLFSETAFLGDNRNFPHAHYAYPMACVGQIDLMSKCEWAAGADNTRLRQHRPPDRSRHRHLGHFRRRQR